MSFKWNENFTLIFLNAYRKYPCLWNPHYVKYYDCLAKNEALQNIVKELNIPELNISDCLEQIKVIRERYRQEQKRVIKRLQLGKSYKSPFAWFPVVAGMLTKVIDDEDKLQNRMESVKTISFSKDYIATPYDKCDKNISNFPCVHRRQDYKTKPRKNTKFTKTGTLDIIDRKSVRQNDAHLLQCPFCGWEDKKYNRLDITTRKAYEQIKPLDIAVPCPEYLANKSYEYKARQHQIADTKYQGKCSNIITCQSFPSRLLSYTGCPADILTTHTYYPQDTRSYINQQMTPREIVTAKSKFCTRETQLSNDQLFPERRRKEVETSSSIQHHDKGIQNTICVSKIETDVRKYYREVQQKPSILQEEAINTTEQCDKQIQNTVCVSLNDCQASPKSFSTREAKQIDANIVKCPANDVRNMIGIKLKTVEGSMPNFVLITTDGNYLPSIQRDLKKLTINKCQKDEDHDQKEMKEIRLDDKKFIKNEACVKETCSSDTMEIIKYNSVVTQALLECLEKVIQERTKICSVTSFLSKRDNVNSNYIDRNKKELSRDFN